MIIIWECTHACTRKKKNLCMAKKTEQKTNDKKFTPYTFKIIQNTTQHNTTYITYI